MTHADSKPDIPAIVTTDLSSTPNLSLSPPDDHHAPDATNTDPGALSPASASRSPHSAYLSPLNVPGSAPRSSLDAPSPNTPSLSPGSPSPSFTSSMETHVPPSPTLSTRSSVHFAAPTTLALRENRPDEKTGMSSLNLLTPHYQHKRKGSVASSMEGSTEGTEPDSHSISLQPLTPQHTGGEASTIASPTQTHYDGASVDGTTMRSRSISRPKLDDDAHPKKSGDEGAEGQQEEARPVLDLAQDESIDAGVFPFKPYKLASLVDPKNMDLLKEMGGVTGLLKGLGTSRKRGLGKKSLGPSAPVSQPQHGKSHTGADEDVRPTTGAGVGASQRHDRQPDTTAGDVPKLVLTGPGGEEGGGVPLGESASDVGDIEEGPTFEASLEERRRVYGANILPTRKTKSLLQLMWLALKDKVLVRQVSPCV